MDFDGAARYNISGEIKGLDKAVFGGFALKLVWTVDRVKYLRKMKTQKLIERIGNSHSFYWKVWAEVK